MDIEAININYQCLSSNGAISLKKLCLSIGSSILLDDTNLVVSEGVNYGIIAPNGHGKSTLLKAIAYKLKIENFNIHMVKQEDSNSDLNVIDEVLSSHSDYCHFITKEKELMRILNGNDEEQVSNANEELENLYEWYRSLGLQTIKPRAAQILSGLGFEIASKTGNWQEKKVNEYSGGWRMRVSLAKALLNEPELLILDEPTNHLDLNAVIWLGDYLQHWNTSKNTNKKSLLLVSHDEDFLDEVCQKIIRIEDKKIKTYTGNYQKMKNMVEQERRVLIKEYEKKKKNIKSKKEQKKIRVKRQYKIDFQFDDTVINGKISLNNIDFKYELNEYILQGLNFNVESGDKFVIVGKNGVGKSTLLKLLTGELKPLKGNKTVSKNIHIGQYYQHFEDSLPMDKTPVEYLQSIFNDHSLQDIRKHLSIFNLDSKAHTILISECSGGQKSRIAFSSLCLSDILILDEPTNHLDLESITGLSEALKKFPGGLVLVSHDAKLIRDLECQIYVCENGNISKFDGDFDDYKEKVLNELKPAKELKTNSCAHQKHFKKTNIKNDSLNTYNSQTNNNALKDFFAKKKKKRASGLNKSLSRGKN